MLQIQPEFDKARRLLEAGVLKDVQRLLDRGLRRNPDDPYGRFLLGMLAYRRGDHRRAADILGGVVEALPGLVEANINLGSSLHRLGRLEEAAACYERVLEIQPDNDLALSNLGGIYVEQARYAEAQRILEKAVAARPDDWLAHHNLAVLQARRKRYAEAVRHYRIALDIHPAPDIYANLIGALKYHDPDASYALAREVACQAAPGYALLAAFTLLVESCEWALVERILPEVLRIARQDGYPLSALQGLLLPLNKVPGVTPRVQFELHRLWGKRAMRHVKVLPRQGRRDARVLRIGYVSADFRDHSVGYFVRNLLAHHDRSRFEVLCYSNARCQDEVTAQIRHASQSFHTVYNLTDEALARRIHADGIDILVDLGGHTADSRLPMFRYRPAPVQITYLGYPNTTGLPTLDYRITDREAESEQGTRYTEKLLFMPESFLCFGAFADAELRSRTPAADSGQLTFGSFNNVNKLTPATIALWSRILEQVENSRLLIKSRNAVKQSIRDNLYQAFAAHGIGPDRIHLEGYCENKRAHLESYNRVDIALDCHPYNGTTTTCEALWMGVPVLTRQGETHASRVSAAILRHIGVEETITGSDDEFVARAVALAGDFERLNTLRRRIPQRLRSSVLCDPARFTAQFEQVLAQAWSEKMGALPWERAADTEPAAAAGETALAVNIQGGIEVQVPDDIGLLTPYVLLEQEDWFEAELAFVRAWLQPGMKVVDIGANYGVYTLAAASRVGEEGKVWCFEPCRTTAAWLRRSVAANKLNNVSLTEAGVSDRRGEARLAVHANPELNAVLAGDAEDDGDSQVIRLVRLDDYMAENRLLPVDLLKLDAGGCEGRVITGGKRFFEQQSPLVLYEIKHGSEWNLALVERFAALGYRSYRLVPGLQLLAPFDPARDVDPMLLNLFCCKDDRAGELAAGGWLVREPLVPQDLPAPPAGRWVDHLARYPFAAQRLEDWPRFMEENVGNAAWVIHQQALDYYVLARQELPAAERHACLECAYRLLFKLLEEHGNTANVQSFVRVALEAGRWQPAREALQFLMQQMAEGIPALPAEPFLPVSEVLEWVDPGADAGAWMKAAVLERFEKTRAHSSYFYAECEGAAANLEEMRRLGFQSPEMERRRQLIAMRSGLQRGPQGTPLLAAASVYNLNPGFWCR